MASGKKAGLITLPVLVTILVGVGFVSQSATIPFVSEFVCNTLRSGIWIELFGESGCLTSDSLGHSESTATVAPSPEHVEETFEPEPSTPSEGLPPPPSYPKAESYFEPGVSEGPESDWPTEPEASEWDYPWLDLDGEGDYVGLFYGFGYKPTCVGGYLSLALPKARCE